MANNNAVAKPSFFMSVTSLLEWIKQVALYCNNLFSQLSACYRLQSVLTCKKWCTESRQIEKIVSTFKKR